MLAGLAVTLLAAAAAQGAEAGPAWAISSANTEITAEGFAAEKGCRVVVRRGSTELWSLEACIGEKGDYRFVSNDGRELLVLFALPSNRSDLKKVKVGELYRGGRVAKAFQLGRFVAEPQRLVMMRRHFYWLEGALGQPGVPPGLSKDGKTVELTTLDRRTYVVGFDGSLKGPPVAQKVRRRR